MKAILLIIFSLFFSQQTLAAKFQASFQTQNPIHWKDIAIGQNQWTPVYWDISMHLPAAEKVILGGAPSIAEQKINLKSLGSSVSLNFAIIGMQYQLSTKGIISPLSSQTKTTIVGDQVTVNGSGLSDQLITYDKLITPFSHFRPIISFQDNITNLFLEKPSGKYTGQTIIHIPYDYYRNNVRIRNTLSFPIEIEIHYSGNSIISVSVIGDNEMQTRYDDPSNSFVSAQTTYQVNITGKIENGIWIGLKPSHEVDGRFYLTRFPLDELSENIPYSVHCQDCLIHNEFIDQIGQPKINMHERAKAINNSFQIKVAFENFELDKITNGTYQGAFTLVLEAIF